MQALIDLLGIKDLIPHGYCLSWSPVLLWLHVISDILITLAYFSIPLTLFHFIRKRKDMPYSWMAVMFAGFIVVCGTTHLLSAITIWMPLYWLEGFLKALTAILSVTSAVMMLWIIPRMLSLPSAAQMQAEIQQRTIAEEALRVANGELQQNIARTQLLLDSALDGIVSMDHSGDVIGWNAQAERIFGYSAEQALGCKLMDLIVPSGSREKHRQGLSRFMMTEVSNIIGTRLEITSLRADGSEFPIELTIGALKQNDSYSFSAYVRDITGRKLAETAKQEALDKLQKIADQLPGVVFQFRLRSDDSCCFPYASDVLRDIYRVNPEEVREDATKVFAVVHPDDLERHWAGIHASARDLSPWRDEYRLKFSDGTERWLSGNALPLREQDGSVLWHGFVTDITEHRIIESELRESEYKFATILDSVEAFIYIKDCNYQYQYGNQAVQQVLGKALDDIVGKSDEDFFDTATLIKLRTNDRRVIELGERAVAEDIFVFKESAIPRTYLTVKQPLRREDGSIYGLCGISTDITERKQMEEKLRDSEGFNISILNSLTSHIAVLDAQGVIVAINNAWRLFDKENSFQESSQNRLGVNYLETCANAFDQPYGDETNAAQAGIVAVLAGERETFHLEYPCHSPDQHRWFQMNVSPLQGLRRGVVVSHENITERKEAEQAAWVASQYSRSLIETSLDPLVTINAEGKITDVNLATEQVTGMERDDLIGSEFSDYFTEPEKAREVYRQVFAQDFVFDYPLAIRHVSGNVIEVLFNASVYYDGNGNVLGILAVARDVTEFKRIQDELTRSNAELEQFGYAVSHDMRQPLRMVTSYLSLIENALTGQLNEETQQFLDFAVNGAKRMDAMILSLLEYSRIGRKFEAKTLVSSKASLDEALAFLKPELSACNGEIKVTGDWPELVACGDELTRLLQNLIGNALKYHKENQLPRVNVHGSVSGALFRVEVLDHGIGIDPGQLERLFKVFSRLQARSKYEGTGVGLALCRKIVEHHGGTIGVESPGEGQGCMFWFELPIFNAVSS
ncbi:MAG: PAS domain S-box protein [Gammaproteobacteria bacterium]